MRKGVLIGTAALIAECVATPVSDATLRNWNRLGSYSGGRLVSRANKRLSRRHIIPIDYFANKELSLHASRIVAEAERRNVPKRAIVYSLAINALRQAGILEKEHVKELLAQHSYWRDRLADEIVSGSPCEGDFIGGVYQGLTSEGERNRDGIYYTRDKVVRQLLKNAPRGKSVAFLDPCCGGGAFLCAVEGVDPRNIYGIDRDPVAVFISKVNLLCKYKDVDFSPNVFCCDFLNPSEKDMVLNVFKMKFDCIATNPPWGAATNNDIDINGFVSRETSALFYVKAYDLLKKDGQISFLLPEAILSVKVHSDFRKYMLEHGSIESIFRFEESFSGVVTRYYGVVSIAKEKQNEVFSFDTKEGVKFVRREEILSRSDYLISYVDDESIELMKTISSAGKLNLLKSTWALGVVTGDNKAKVHSVKEDGMEPIFTGKDVSAFVLNHPSKYIHYERSQMQQVAREEFYRAKEKLVYRFVFDRPLFAYDNTQSLCLNSANILIPNVDGMDIKTVLAFLNSDIIHFYYKKRFGGVKVLKSSLCELPLPQISKEKNAQICELVDAIIDGDQNREMDLQFIIGDCYRLSSNEVLKVREKLYGKAR